MVEKYYLKRGDQIRGPFSIEKIREFEAQGKLRASDLFSTQVDRGWKSLRSIMTIASGKSTPWWRLMANSRSRLPIWIGAAVFALVATTAGLWQLQPWKTEPEISETRASQVEPKSSTAQSNAELSVNKSETESVPQEVEQPYKDGLKIRLSNAEVLTLSGSDSRIESRLISAMLRVLTDDMKFSAVFRWKQKEQTAEIPADRVTVVIQPPKIRLFEGVNGCAFPLSVDNAEQALNVVMVAFIRCSHANSFETGHFSTSGYFDLGAIAADVRNIASSPDPAKKSHFESTWKQLRDHELGVLNRVYNHATLKLDDGHALFSHACPLVTMAILTHEMESIYKSPGTRSDNDEALLLSTLEHICDVSDSVTASAKLLTILDALGLSETVKPLPPASEWPLQRKNNVLQQLAQETRQYGDVYHQVVSEVKQIGGMASHTQRTREGLPVINIHLMPRPNRKENGASSLSLERLISSFSQLTALIDLSLTGAGSDYPGPAIAAIGNTKNLRSLNIIPEIDSIDEAFLQKLCLLPELKHISLRGVRCTDTGLTTLSQLTRLQYLSIGGERLTDAGVATLARHPNLVTLELSACPNVTARSCDTFASIQSLTTLRLHKTGILAADVRILRRERPYAKILLSATEHERWLVQQLHDSGPGISYQEPVALGMILKSIAESVNAKNEADRRAANPFTLSFSGDEVSLKQYGWTSLDDVMVDGIQAGLQPGGRNLYQSLSMILQQVWQAELEFNIQDDRIVISANPPRDRKGGVVGVGRGPWLSHEAFQQDFNVNSAAGLRVSEVFADYDSKSKQLRYSAVWLNGNGNAWHVKHGISDEQLANDKARNAQEGYTTCKVGTAKMKGMQYHIALWTRPMAASKVPVTRPGPGIQSPEKSPQPQTLPAESKPTGNNNSDASKEQSKADFMSDGTKNWGPAFVDVYKVQLNNSSASIVKIGTNRAGTAQLTFTVPSDWAAARKKLTNDELLAISRLTGPVELNLDNVSAYTEQELAQLGQCQGLEILTFRCDHDRNLGFLKSLSNLQNLKWLIASGEGIADPCTLHMKNFTHLTYLGMKDTKVTDSGIRVLTGMSSLEQLFLVNSQIRGDGFAAFKEHGRLQHIRLAGCKSLDEKSILSLSSISSLKKLECYDTNLGQQAAANLKKARSTLTVEIKGANSED